MYKDRKISLTIPCYNEEAGLTAIFKKIPNIFDEVIVVDNNCTDNTVQVAKTFGAKIFFEGKRGYGWAHQAGFAAALGDIVVTMDGGDSYPLQEIEPLIKKLIDDDLDFISGCRFPLRSERSMSFLNRLGNFILTIFFRILTGRFIRDSQSGLWIFKKEILQKIKPKNGGMPFSEEIKMEIILNRNIKFKEIPINYFNRIGEVKLRKWKDGWECLIFLFKKRMDIFLR